MYLPRILIFAVACLLMTLSANGASGPERSPLGRMAMPAGQQPYLGEAGPADVEPAVTPTLATPIEATVSADRHSPKPSKTTTTAKSAVAKRLLAPRPAQDPAQLRRGWVSWAAFVSGVISLAAMLTAYVVAIFIWEYFAIFTVIWLLGALLSLVLGCIVLCSPRVNHRRIGTAGFILGVTALALPFLLLLGLIVYAFSFQ